MAYTPASGFRVRPLAPGQTFSYAPVAPLPTAETSPAIHRCAPGPWGNIEYSFLHIEASEHLVSHFKMPSTTTRWTFSGTTRDKLCAFLDSVRIPPNWLERWMSPAHFFTEGGDVHLLPPNEDLESLMPEQRSAIYAVLAHDDRNAFHHDPVLVTGGDAKMFLKDSGIAADHAAWFARMCYRRGAALCFSDVHALIRRARSDSEARRLFKLCSRTRAIVARLRITSQTHFPEVLDYWSDNQRRKDVLPMLQSLAEARLDLDIVHLLPPLVRKLLNSYAPLSLAVNGRMPDCHWTSLNFFEYEPREYYLDTRLASQHVLENYDRVEKPYRYGDVLFFLTGPSHEAIHSCVYLADNLVFSKNGENAAYPWIITRLEDIEQIYLTAPGDYMTIWRRRH